MESNLQPMALRPKEAAAMLSVSTRTLYTLTKRGEIPCVKLGKGKGSAVLYRISDLGAWLAQAATKGGNK